MSTKEGDESADTISKIAREWKNQICVTYHQNVHLSIMSCHVISFEWVIWPKRNQRHFHNKEPLPNLYRPQNGKKWISENDTKSNIAG
ncbi:uncharacterized protein G2W53_025061 [Senna tora]|uniref:Uncharacterized protein n=1 Tax=Senna tora TaxID=362788 RepID=A0A834WHJ0_9FABA|nr:uncharacterized protein G2W53_025061 [Senna tora]